jgi:LysM repeat protein
MASLNVRLPAYVRTSPDKTRMVIRTIDGKWKYHVRMAPVEMDYPEFGSRWAEVPVPGRAPFLVKEAFGLKKVSFSLIVTDPDNPDADMTNDLRILKAFADTTRPIKIAYDGYFTSWTWRCTSMTIHSEQRHPANSKITRATVDMEFTEKNDVKDYTGPVTGGAKTNKKKTNNNSAGRNSSNKKKTSNDGKKKKNKTKVYIVKRGDTLSGISYKLYGDVSRWRELASENKIRNPHLIYPGDRIKY